MRVAIYTRVSTEEQARGGTSLETQDEKLTGWANLFGHTIVDRYVDGGYSGKDGKRPELQRMMRDAETKKFEAVVTTKLDRFFRNLKLLLEHEERLRNLDISYIAVDDNVDTSKPEGRLMFHILGVVAEWERERIGQRIRDARIGSKLKGKVPAGKILYGYSRNEEGKYQINDEEAQIVKRIFSLYVDERLGMGRVAERLNQDDIPTGGWGKCWSDQRVGFILPHPDYTGNEHIPAIIDKQTWRLAQKRIEMQNRRGHTKVEWLLQQLVVCGDCGLTYRCQRYSSGRRVYRCWGRNKIRHLDGSPRCNNIIVDADWLEKELWQSVRACLEDSELLRQSILNSLEKVEETRNEIAKLCEPTDKQLVKVQEKMHRLDVKYEVGRIGDNEYRQQITDLKKEEANLKQQRRAIDPQKVEQLEICEGYLEWAKSFWGIAKLKVHDSGLISGYDEQSIELVGGLTEGTINLSSGLTSNLNGGTITPRAILERFNITVWVKGDEVEVRGLLPNNILTPNSVS